MKIGSFTAELLSEGRFEVFEDGHINRTPVDQSTHSDRSLKIPERSSLVGINPVLVRTEHHNILIDTGLGWGLDASSGDQNVSNVKTNLEIFRLQPKDITHVVLSHLHYDHIAGGTYTGKDFTVKPTFPNATYFVQQEEWEYALSQTEQDQELKEVNYQLDDFYRLVADKRIEFLQQETTEIEEGISLIKTGGHTPGHQIVQLQSQGEYAYYLGDLFPSKPHLTSYPKKKWDVDPLSTSMIKSKLFKEAHQKDAILFLYHSLYGDVGRISINRDEDEYIFEEIPL